jgi:hypothetical protein
MPPRAGAGRAAGGAPLTRAAARGRAARPRCPTRPPGRSRESRRFRRPPHHRPRRARAGCRRCSPYPRCRRKRLCRRRPCRFPSRRPRPLSYPRRPACRTPRRARPCRRYQPAPIAARRAGAHAFGRTRSRADASPPPSTPASPSPRSPTPGIVRARIARARSACDGSLPLNGGSYGSLPSACRVRSAHRARSPPPRARCRRWSRRLSHPRRRRGRSG